MARSSSVVVALGVSVVGAPGLALGEAGVEPPRQLAISVSGGASLGAYEGGFLYSLVEDLRTVSPVVQPRGFFGTSAGAINAFLAILQTCTAPPENAEASAFYRTWMPIGFEALFEGQQGNPMAALSRSALEAPVVELRKEFERGLSKDCDLLLGVTGTRVTPHRVSRADGRLRLPRMDAQFLLRVEGRGIGQVPKVSNNAGSRDRSLPLLPLDGPDVSAFDALLEAILASSAFPFAFEPVTVKHCPGRRGQRKCRPEDARGGLFLDGGIFDQNPVRVGIEEVGSTTVAMRRRAQLYLLDPFQRRYPQPVASATDDGIRDAVDYATKIVSGFVETARSQGLELLLREDPSLESRLVVGASEYPPYGDMAFYFLSFFEESLRQFDFILGMIESRRALQRAQTRAVLLGDMTAARAMEQAFHARGQPEWAAHRCVDAVLGLRPVPPDRLKALCEGEENRLFPLALVSRERVYDACRPDRWPNLDPADAERIQAHPDCKRAFAGEAPPGADPNWRRGPDERELQWVFRRLQARGFHFEDLGQTTSANTAFETLRERILVCASNFASAQNAIPGLPDSIARALVNSSIGYRPPQWTLHVAIGNPQEFGVSYAVGPSPVPWLRLTAALELRGLPTVLSAREDYLGLAATAGLEAELLPFSGAGFQVRTGVRGGWLFGEPDSGGFGECVDPRNSERPCSRPVVDGILSVHVIDLLRLSLSGQFTIGVRSGERTVLRFGRISALR